ncbi:hypothetical protein PYCCODRAFT_1437795 [Trametes coccinea BRFM310]|uniref:Uncharacterized protein n=1 Tax=Trametes coccinea (strain BRFM310) TaxID=1353009 RepID=A0A1Y2IFR5_TRAC3|nr:hypothetical protein PYCCODRAFT_1437795 [Trametes coccinea BRFM310]
MLANEAKNHDLCLIYTAFRPLGTRKPFFNPVRNRAQQGCGCHLLKHMHGLFSGTPPSSANNT